MRFSVFRCVVFCLLKKSVGVQIRVDLETREHVLGASGVDSESSSDSGYFFGILADPQLGMFQTYEKSETYRVVLQKCHGNVRNWRKIAIN